MLTQAAFDISTSSFRTVDVSALSKELRLEAAGAERGAIGQPAKSAKIPDAHEQNVENRIVGIARQARDELTNYLKTIRDRLAPLTTKNLANQIRSEHKRSWRDMFEDVRNTVNLLFNLKREAMEAEKWLHRFREANALTRPAHYPDSHAFDVWLIVFLFLVESGANAFLMSDAMETGWIGALVVMFFISVVNISSGFVLGLLVFRQFHHRSPRRRGVAVLLTIAIVAWLLAWNLLIGHYRDALVAFAMAPVPGINVARLGQVAVESFFSEKALVLGDFKSYLAFVIGTIIAFASSWKGYFWDDEYPGYGRVYRAQKRKTENYGRAFEAGQIRLEELVLAGRRRVDEVAESAHVYERESVRLANVVLQLQAGFRSYVLQLERDAAQLLQIYRDANLASRGEEGPPSYWGKRFQLGKDLKEPVVFQELPSIEVKDAERAAEIARGKIDAYAPRFLSVYRTIDRLSDSELEGFAAEELLAAAELEGEE